jgi:hypothetical protein
MRSDDLQLTQSEIDKGWHFCPEWDDLLIGPGMDELQNFLDPVSLVCACGYKLPKTYVQGTDQGTTDGTGGPARGSVG